MCILSGLSVFWIYRRFSPLYGGCTKIATLSCDHIDQKRTSYPEDIKQEARHAKGQKYRPRGNYLQGNVKLENDQWIEETMLAWGKYWSNYLAETLNEWNMSPIWYNIITINALVRGNEILNEILSKIYVLPR